MAIRQRHKSFNPLPVRRVVLSVADVGPTLKHPISSPVATWSMSHHVNPHKIPPTCQQFFFSVLFLFFMFMDATHSPSNQLLTNKVRATCDSPTYTFARIKC